MTFRFTTQFTLFAFCSLFFISCSTKSIIVSSLGGFLDDAFVAVNEESDLSIAEASIASNLKLLDAMLKTKPNDEHLLLLASQGYAGFALGFVEDENKERAKELYLRSKNYAQKILLQQESFRKGFEGTVEELQSALKTSPKENIPAIFWTALSWGSSAQLDLTNPDAIAAIPKIEMMMKFVAENDSAYYFSGANFFLGALYGSRAKMFGGDPEKSQQYFEKALRINEGKFLLTQIYYAKYYCVQTQNQELFEQLLTTVDNTSLDISPEQKLTNAIAKKKAKLLREKISELF